MRIEITADQDKKKEILAAIKANGGYCPCRIEHTPENRCMCEEFKDMESGTCHCGLYTKYKD